MNVIRTIKSYANSQEFLAHLIVLILVTLFLGYTPSSIALAVFIFFSIRYTIIHTKKVQFDFVLLLPMVLYLVFVLTIFWTVNQGDTMTGLGRTISLFLIPVAFTLIPKISIKNVKLILNLFTISNILLGLIFIISSTINFLKTKSISVFTYHNLVSVFDLHAIYVSLSFSISLFYLLSKSPKKIYDKLLIFYFLALMILLSSKAIMAVLAISVLVYLYCYEISKFNKKIVITISIIVILIIGLSSITLRDRFVFERDTDLKEVLVKKEFGNIYPWTGSSIRLLQLRILKEQIEEESIFWKGFGLFASRDNVKKRHEEFGTYITFHNYNYHNQYAQILSEVGVWGLILLLMMLVTTIFNAFNTKNFLSIMICISFSVLFFTESLLWRQQGLFLFVLFYCISNRTNLEIK